MHRARNCDERGAVPPAGSGVSGPGGTGGVLDSSFRRWEVTKWAARASSSELRSWNSYE